MGYCLYKLILSVLCEKDFAGSSLKFLLFQELHKGIHDNPAFKNP
jgi:hypothetical protein